MSTIPLTLFGATLWLSVLVSIAAAQPPSIEIDAFDSSHPVPVAGPPGPGLNYATGFEPEEGFVLGYLKDQPGGCSPVSPCWGISMASNASQHEAHIDTAHPATGLQHVRLAYDASVPHVSNTNPVAARFPRNEDVTPQPLAPISFSFDLSIDSVPTQEWKIFVQNRQQGLATTVLWFYFDGDINLILVLDDRSGTPEWNVGHSWVMGIYQPMTITIDPCNDLITVSYANNPFYFHSLWSATNADQIVFVGDNSWWQGNFDIDNFRVETGPLCPVYGACCDTNGPGQGCYDNVLDTSCAGDGQVFTANAACVDIQCTCIPECGGRVCGPDGCGGFCGNCSNANVCDGLESCNAQGQCEPGTPLLCDDGLFCNGAEVCNSLVGCVAGTNPCASDETCDELIDECTASPPPSIPTLQTWGLVALTLALLIAAKYRFGSRVNAA